MNDMTHSHVRHYLFIYEVTAALHDGITVESRVYAYTHTLLLSLTHANTHACTHTKEITETFNDGITVEACIYTYTHTRTLSHTHTYTHTCTPTGNHRGAQRWHHSGVMDGRAGAIP